MIPFTKAHAYGNDFLYVRAASLEETRLDPVRLAIRLCERHVGIGADGLVVYTETPDGARMRLINADGSPSEVSGNGVRALGALLARARGWHGPPDGAQSFTIHTDAGPKVLHLLEAEGPARYTFRADMGRPEDIARVRLAVAGEHVDAIRLRVGNPQCVVLGPLQEERLARLGSALQTHAAFPEAVNFELAEVVARDRVRILIWERGVGRTESSGTGSCAAAVAAMTAELVDRVVEIEAPGGVQRVEWGDAGLFLTGWAEVLFEGDWIPDADAAAGLRSR